MLEAATSHFVGDDHVEAVALKDGRSIAADLAVVAVGITPNAEIAKAAGLAVKRGILVDDHLVTTTADVFAIGECAEHRGVCCGLVEPANEQARVLAERLAGRDACYRGSVNATNLKVSGVNVFSAGDFLGGPGTEDIVFSDGLGCYRKLVVADGRLAGAVLGDTADALWISTSSVPAPRSKISATTDLRPGAGRAAGRVVSRCEFDSGVTKNRLASDPSPSLCPRGGGWGSDPPNKRPAPQPPHPRFLRSSLLSPTGMKLGPAP